MAVFKGLVGLFLLILAGLKIIFMVSLLVQGDSGRPTLWFMKQTVYAVAFAMIGSGLVRSKPDAEAELSSDEDQTV